MKWRRRYSIASVLYTESITARSVPGSIHNLSTQLNAGDNNIMDTILSKTDTNSIGGGAINEKQRLYMQTSNTHNSDKPAHDGIESGNRSWDPNRNLSHMLHALVGLDRYPNYLSRFKDVSDMDVLEYALESRLSDVRKQKSEIVQRRKGIQQLVERYLISINGEEDEAYVLESPEEDCSTLWRKHPLLSTPKTWIDLHERKILQEQAFKVAHHSISSTYKKQKRNAKGNKSKKHTINTDDATDVEGSNSLPNIEDIIVGKVKVDLDPALLEDWMDQEMFDVYSFSLLTPEFCSILRTTLRDLSTLAESDEFSHLNFGRRVIDLDSIGLGWVTDLLFHVYIKPISQHLFATTEKLVDADDVKNDASPILDWRQGYVAGYSADPTGSKGVTRHRLVPHTDDAEVTLNCCLGEETFEGGSVEFYGLRGTPEEGQLVGRVKRPNIGTALLHSGRHLHAVSQVTSGDRYAFIIWTRSWHHLRSNTCPCCWLNRRQDSTCICDKRWN